MASTVDELRTKYDKITETNREAYDAIHAKGYLSNGMSLDAAYKAALAGRINDKVGPLKAAFDKATATYKKTQEAKNALKKELNAAEKELKKTEEKNKTSKTVENTYNKAVDELKAAELDFAGYQGQEKYVAAYQKAQLAFDAAKAAGVTPKRSLPVAKTVIPAVEQTTQNNGTGNTGSTGATGAIETVGSILGVVAEDENLLKALQEDLKKNFPKIYKGSADGRKSWAETQKTVETILQLRGSLPAALKGIDFRTFIKDANSADLILTGGSGSGNGQPGVTISGPTDAASTINYAIKGLLGRDATPTEVSSLTKILNDAQRKNPARTVNGVTTTALDSLQFLTDVIKTGQYGTKKVPSLAKLASEYTTKQTEKTNLTAQTIAATAKANGITLNDPQLQAYATAVKNGTDIETVKSQIRNLVASTMPDNVKKLMADGTDLDTIYSPYKYSMEQILEVPRDSIDLNDPTLREAISSNGQMTLYDFQKNLRKDPRWQYTNNAREVVSSGLTQVLKDFGFMG